MTCGASEQLARVACSMAEEFWNRLTFHFLDLRGERGGVQAFVATREGSQVQLQRGAGTGHISAPQHAFAAKSQAVQNIPHPPHDPRFGANWNPNKVKKGLSMTDVKILVVRGHSPQSNYFIFAKLRFTSKGLFDFNDDKMSYRSARNGQRAIVVSAARERRPPRS